MKAILYIHEQNEGAGILAPALRDAGFQCVERFRAARREDVDAQLVVVLGGLMGAYEADQHPFLEDELRVLRERLALDRPVLGVCLGAQLLAAAAGAEVYLGKNGMEVGALPVRWTKEGLADPVIRGVSAKTVVAQWHQDTFKAVPGATLLASTDRYTQQAFRLGTSYAFQFHLELTADALDRWLSSGFGELGEKGKDIAALRVEAQRLKAAEPELRALADRLAHHFASVARGAATAPRASTKSSGRSTET